MTSCLIRKSEKASLVIFAALVGIPLIGCEHHEEKVAVLKQNYEAAEKRFQNDCAQEVRDSLHTYSPKCAAEKRDRDKAEDLLRDEQVQR